MGASVTQLPRGRHQLTREQVVADQRRRMLDALATCMARSGYVGTSVADVLRLAGVSRETFYQQFASKQDCFVAAFEEQSRRLLRSTSQAMPTTGSPADRVAVLIGAYLDALAADPAVARLFLIEVYAAGSEVLALRTRMQGRFEEGMARLLEARTERDRFACESVVAAITTLVTSRLAAGDVEGVRALHAPLVALVRRLFPDPGTR